MLRRKEHKYITARINTYKIKERNRLVEFRFKAPPGTTSSSITTNTSSGQRNCASWASQPQKSVTFLPCPGGRITKSTKDMWWHWTKKSILSPTGRNKAKTIPLLTWTVPEGSRSLRLPYFKTIGIWKL